jgi:hypothetical protein
MESEKILGVYPMDLRGGLTRCYDVYFTNQRIIASYLESRMLTRFWGHGCLLWSYYLLDYIVVAPLTRRRGEKPTADPEQILQADNRNFAWSFQDDIKAVRFKRKTGAVGPPHIEIELTGGQRNVLFHTKESRNELIKLIQEIVPDKVTVE